MNHPFYEYYGINIDTKEEIGPFTIIQLIELGYDTKKVKGVEKGDRGIYRKMKWRRVAVPRRVG